MVTVLIAFMACSAVLKDCQPVTYEKTFPIWLESSCDLMGRQNAWNYLMGFARPDLALVIESEVTCVVVKGKMKA